MSIVVLDVSSLVIKQWTDGFDVSDSESAAEHDLRLRDFQLHDPLGAYLLLSNAFHYSSWRCCSSSIARRRLSQSSWPSCHSSVNRCDAAVTARERARAAPIVIINDEDDSSSAIAHDADFVACSGPVDLRESGTAQGRLVNHDSERLVNHDLSLANHDLRRVADHDLKMATAASSYRASSSVSHCAGASPWAPQHLLSRSAARATATTGRHARQVASESRSCRGH